MPIGTRIISYADDTAVVVMARIFEQLVSDANTSLRCWQQKRLRFKPKELKIMVENMEIKTRPTLKYLGVIFDHNLRMTEHPKRAPREAVRETLGYPFDNSLRRSYLENSAPS